MASERPNYERSDVDPKVIAMIASGLAAFVVAIPLLMPLVYPQSSQRKPVQPLSRPAAAPFLLVNPLEQLARFRLQEDHELKSYAWDDRQHTKVRIPIDQAMRKLVDAGLPGWPRR